MFQGWQGLWAGRLLLGRSVKVMGAVVLGASSGIEALKAVGQNIDHPLVSLQGPMDDQGRGGDQGDPVSLEEVGHDDDVGHTVLVFQGHEEDALCRSGALTTDHQAPDLHPRAVGQVR